jgi:excinuclease ABC subunit C
VPGKKEPLRLSRKNKARLLLQAIRDEAHRFAINYNRLLRKKRLTSKN